MTNSHHLNSCATHPLKSGSVSVHNRDNQKLATDIYKMSKDVSPLQMTELFGLANRGS